MARTVAELPPGARITDYISLGVITKTFPLSVIGPVLSKTGTASVRQRDLPAQVVVYYVIALALYMQSSYREVLRCLLEAVQWLSANPFCVPGGEWHARAVRQPNGQLPDGRDHLGQSGASPPGKGHALSG